MTPYGIFVFILVFAILVFFHELGHFLAAKMYRMRVEEFAFGFGPAKLRLFYDGETEYTVRPIPLGGFVKIAGMEIEEATAESANDADKPRDGFNYRPLYQRFVVILAGPVFSFLLGWLTLCLIGILVGEPKQRLVIAAQVISGGVAQTAGVRAGETLTALNGKPVEDTQRVVADIRKSAGIPVTFTLKDKAGATRNVTVIPKTEFDGAEKIGRVGVAFQESYDMKSGFRRLGLVESFQRGTESTLLWFMEMGKLVRSGEIRDSVGGPVAILSTTQKVADIGGIGPPMLLLGQLSLSLGVANLLPIPILDGGYLVLFTIEAIRRRKLTARQMERVMLGGFAVLATLFITITFRDVRSLLFPSPSPAPTATPAASPSPR